MRIPTDLLGMTTGRYDAEKLEDSPKAATATFCNDVRLTVKKHGFLRQVELPEVISRNNQEEEEPKPSSKLKINKNDWAKLYFENKFDDAIEAINLKLEDGLDAEDNTFFNAMIAVCKVKSNPASGIKRIEDYLQDNQDSVHAWQAVSYFYLEDILFQKAEKTIDEGLSRFPNDFTLLKHKAELLHRKGKPIDAAELLKEFIGLDEVLLDKYIEYCIEAGIQYEALETVRIIFLNNSYSEYIVSSYAKLAYDEEKYKVALYLYVYLDSLYPNNAYYKAMLASTSLTFNFYDIAYKNYKASSELHKGNGTSAIENMGNILQTLGLYEEAKTHFLKAVETNKNSAYAYSRLSNLIELQKQEETRFDKIRIEGRIEAFFRPDESSARLIEQIS